MGSILKKLWGGNTTVDPILTEYDDGEGVSYYASGNENYVFVEDEKGVVIRHASRISDHVLEELSDKIIDAEIKAGIYK